MDEMSAVSTAASASMSKVRHAAALNPAGHVIGTGEVALLTRLAVLAGLAVFAWSPWAAARSALVIRGLLPCPTPDRTCHARYRTGSEPGPARAIRPGRKPS